MPLTVGVFIASLIVITAINVLPRLIPTRVSPAEYEKHRDGWKIRLTTAVLPMLSAADAAGATWDFKRVSNACGDALSNIIVIKDEMQRVVPPPSYQQGHEQMLSSLVRMQPALEACKRGDFARLSDLRPGR